MDIEKLLKEIPTTAAGESAKKCASCGRQINQNFRFCNFCGAAQAEELSETQYMSEDNFRLVKLALSYLENGDFINTDKVCKSILIAEPRNALVYFVLLMSELQFRYEKQFEHNTRTFANSLNYEAIMLYGDEDIKSKVYDYEKMAGYNIALRLYEQAENINGKKDSYSWASRKYEEAAEAFKKCGSYKEAERYVFLCRQKAELSEKNNLYEMAEEHFKAGTSKSLGTAAFYYKKLGNFKDSENKLRLCIERRK